MRTPDFTRGKAPFGPHITGKEPFPMRTLYTDMDIRFTMDHIPLRALNIIFERFTRIIPSHSHGSGCYEIHFISAGYGKLGVDRQYCPEQAPARKREALSVAGSAERPLGCGKLYYDITPGTLYITGPHVEHAQIPMLSDPMEEYCVYLKIDNSGAARKEACVMDIFLEKPFWFGQDTQGMGRLMEQLFEELEHGYIGYQHQVRLLLSQLLICTVRNYTQRQASRTAFARSNRSDAKSVIIEELFLYEYATLSLGSLAQRLNVSPRQAQRLLREYYGKSFQQKKTEARMSAASILLTDHVKSFTSIAEELGYSSQEHFSSAFRKYYGMSPREYRKQDGEH